MSDPLLSTKLFAPPLHPIRVARPRLLQQLEQGLRQGHSLALVSAPAGYGKTTLILEWLQSASEAGRVGGDTLPSSFLFPSPAKTAWLSLCQA